MLPSPPPLRPVGYTWTEDTIHGATVYRKTFEVIAYVEQSDGRFREDLKRIRFEKLPVADCESERGSD